MLSSGFCSWRRSYAYLLAIGLAAGVSVAAKHFVMPEAHPAKTYPAHDEHPNEGVTLGVDPYDIGDKTNIFTVRYHDVGFLPLFVVITNDSNQPIALAGSKAEFVTHDRSKIFPATPDDIFRRIARPIGEVSPSPSPLPWPRKAKGSVSKEVQEEVDNSQFVARAVEPHSSQSGFMFFDVAGIDTPLAGAHFYLTGVRDSKGNDLMYFEVPLEKYLGAPNPSP
ncbi:MAG TPA: hypothetical protein VEI99_03380 [Terriglobales bacterium]|nr:hypothetical protein [Terriglobales bacterium]